MTKEEDNFHRINQVIKHHNGLKRLGTRTCFDSILKNKGVVVNVDTTNSVSRAEITLDTRGSFAK